MKVMKEFGLGFLMALPQALTFGRSEVIYSGTEVRITPKQEENSVLRFIAVQLTINFAHSPHEACVSVQASISLLFVLNIVTIKNNFRHSYQYFQGFCTQIVSLSVKGSQKVIAKILRMMLPELGSRSLQEIERMLSF